MAKLYIPGQIYIRKRSPWRKDIIPAKYVNLTDKIPAVKAKKDLMKSLAGNIAALKGTFEGVEINGKYFYVLPRKVACTALKLGARVKVKGKELTEDMCR